MDIFFITYDCRNMVIWGSARSTTGAYADALRWVEEAYNNPPAYEMRNKTEVGEIPSNLRTIQATEELMDFLEIAGGWETRKYWRIRDNEPVANLIGKRLSNDDVPAEEM